VDDGAGRRREQSDRPRQERQLALATWRERALRFEPALELLEPRTQLADVVELDLVDDEAEPPRLAEEVDSPAEDEHLAVLRQRRDAPRLIGEKDSIQPADAVLNRKVEMARGAPLHAADLALDEQRGERPELPPYLDGELGDRVGTLGFLGSQHEV
jgi:hypothetical protein